MIVTSFIEIISIGLVLPFLGIFTSPEIVFSHSLMQPLVRWLGATNPEQLFLPLTLVFIASALLAGAMRLLLLWATNYLAFNTGADLSIAVYKLTLCQPYSVHTMRNSSKIIDGITAKTNTLIYGAMLPGLNLLSSSVMLIVVMVTLLQIDPAITLMVLLGVVVFYLGSAALVGKRLKFNSQQIAANSVQRIKSLQESLGGIRDILIDGSQDVYCQHYHRTDLDLRRAEAANQFISQSPRFLLETLAMVTIAVLAYIVARQPTGISYAIPVLGAIALGTQRLLPVLHQLYQNWVNFKGNKTSLSDALELLDQPLPMSCQRETVETMAFENCIELKHVGFRYQPDLPWVFRGINLKIEKCSFIGFTGRTGSGKSTLLDILMGLQQPTEGAMYVDGKKIDLLATSAWQLHVAHVPQTVYLSDATIMENIAFGVPKDEIDLEKVKHAAEQAQLASTIAQWRSGYLSRVGEGGIRLSGGQKQRIGIARAFYKNADVIIFDEATNALDSDTEKAVMQAIQGLRGKLTVLMVAHRASSLEKCDAVVNIADAA